MNGNKRIDYNKLSSGQKVLWVLHWILGILGLLLFLIGPTGFIYLSGMFLLLLSEVIDNTMCKQQGIDTRMRIVIFIFLIIIFVLNILRVVNN